MLKKLTIQKRLLASFTLVVALFTLLLLYVVSNMGTMNGRLHEIKLQSDQDTQNTGIRGDIFELNSTVEQALVAGTPAAAVDARTVNGKTSTELQDKLSSLKASPENSAEEKRDLAALENQIVNVLMPLWARQLAAVEAGHTPDAVGLIGEVSSAVDKADQTSDALRTSYENGVQSGYSAGTSNYKRVRLLSIVATFLVSALSFLAGWFISRNVSGTVRENALALSTASEESAGLASQLSSNAAQAAAQANVVSSAAEQVSNNVQTVATAVEEMTASVNEIAQSVDRATKVAAEAVASADSTNATVSKLGESSAEIGKVVEVITSIAEQTNLLALNATIEAARAGEAGKGFAVVANEVKELAKQTARATGEISGRIGAIQTDTAGAVGAIGQISSIINQIADIQSTIAVAVEEQSATTNEISRSVTEAALGSAEIAENISSVAQAAASTTEGASAIRVSAGVLARMADDLLGLVGQGRAVSARPAPPAQKGPRAGLPGRTLRLSPLAGRAASPANWEEWEPAASGFDAEPSPR